MACWIKPPTTVDLHHLAIYHAQHTKKGKEYQLFTFRISYSKIMFIISCDAARLRQKVFYDLSRDEL
ncbi:hypothetical protein [Prolixibacter sp. SD074]|uniref:hypothetical protein n=1 Tax=Prolixibacter sp. SD074 TaxID=2652391 RepID=UPI00127B7666|nr:hypothetical protein [Prolixibacter sp. SD074]GET30884.1 hypothetical protein SD074_30860 [Prolixibacter sp. SD074]